MPPRDESTPPIKWRKMILAGHVLTPLDFSAGPLSVEVDSLWRLDAINLGYPRLANNLYEFPEGYRLVVPLEGSTVMECSHGHVAVYTHHFEFRLRFPLDSFLVKILNASNVCLAQLNPLAARNLMLTSGPFGFSISRKP